MTPPSDLSAEKIGQIALMQSVVSQLPTVESILSFSARGLRELPGVSEVNGIKNGGKATGDGEYFNVAHRQQLYAHFEFVISDPTAFFPYRPYVENYCSVLAIIFEERRQRTENQNLLATLEQRVATRTKALQQEIQDRKRAERELRSSEENLRITLDSIGDAVIATDTDGKITRMNPVAEKLTGWNQKEAAGKPLTTIFDIINATTRQPLDNPVERVLSTGQVVGLTNHTVLRSRNGPEYQVADSAAPIRSNDGTIQGVVLVFRDVTEEYAIQEKLRQAEKMSAVGQLAGGIAHDFNNQLTGILGYAEILNDSLTDPSLLDFSIGIKKAALRSAGLIAQLLAFGRKGKYQDQPLDADEVITDTIKILERSIDKRIVIKRDLAPRKPMIMGDPNQLQNAILNIALNARDAMPNGGTLSFRTESIHFDEPFCSSGKLQDIAPGEYVRITISDTGTGMDKETQRHIFEPFFTTKEVGKGTGMGLASVYGTLKNHFGAVDVQSELGQGTTFSLYLPSIQEEDGKQEDAPSPAARNADILLVDDEPTVHSVASLMLRSFEHTVHTCPDGHAAIAFYSEHWQEIDLVILDMIMPNLNGRETAEALYKINPSVRILISSGFSQDDDTQELNKIGVLGFINKPYRLKELSAAVANALSKSK
ncbi:MAG: response regulator [Pontiellaceae bacterium]|nr:response regulator [Pontiellaceae bacterium]